jgi:hypothetical protein
MGLLQAAADEAPGEAAACAVLAARQALARMETSEVQSLLTAARIDGPGATPARSRHVWQRLRRLVMAGVDAMQSPHLAAALAHERVLEQVTTAYEREAWMGRLLDAAELPPGTSAERRRLFIDRLVAEQAGIRALLLRLVAPLADREYSGDLSEAAAAADACLQAAFAEQIAEAGTQQSRALAALARLRDACRSDLDRALASAANLPPGPPLDGVRPGDAADWWDTLPPALAERLARPYARPFPPGCGERLRRYFSNLPPDRP